MNLTPSEAKRLGIDAVVSAGHSVKVKKDKLIGGSVCDGVIEAVYHMTGIRGVTEHCFHPIRKWRFDVAFPTLMIAAELNGYTSHSKRGRMEEDNVKLAAAVRMGWRVFYATKKQMERQVPLWIVELSEASPTDQQLGMFTEGDEG
jgi:hypothetical protein